MKRFLAPTAIPALLLAAISAFAQLPARAADLLDVRDEPNQPVRLIFDTDIGGDIDDAFALAIIHYFAERGRCELLGVTVTNAEESAAKFSAALNAHYGRPDIPVGFTTKGCRKTDNYPTGVITQKRESGELEYPVPESYRTRQAVPLLRELLAKSPDKSVVIVQVGACTNLAALLETPADDISPLTGRELAEKKVRLVSVMGGAFIVDESSAPYKGHREWNIISNVDAARNFAKNWHGSVVYSGYEVGDRIRMSPVNLKSDYLGRGKILHDAFGYWTTKNTKEGFNHRRPTWDLTSVLFVLRPEEGRGYFTLSEPGFVEFTEKGETVFTPDPKGNARCFLTDAISRARVEEAFVNLCSAD